MTSVITIRNMCTESYESTAEANSRTLPRNPHFFRPNVESCENSRAKHNTIVGRLTSGSPVVCSKFTIGIRTGPGVHEC